MNDQDLSNQYQENIDKLGSVLGISQAFDIDTRDIVILNHRMTFFFCTFLIDERHIAEIIEGLQDLNQEEEVPEVKEFLHLAINNMLTHSVSLEKNIDNLAHSVLTGQLVVLVEGSNEAIISDIRKYPGRNIGEPDLERVVRGSRDGFTETLAINLALVRRRIKTGKLKTIIYQIGSESRTEVVLLYIEDKVDPEIMEFIKKSLSEVDVVELTMSDKALEEIMMKQRFSPYPLVRYTERPDTLAVQLYQGMFGILVDTSPSAIMGPVSIFDHMQHAEEYRQTPIAGSYLRLLRFFGIFASFLLVPLWFAFIHDYSWLPPFFASFYTSTASRETIFFQVIIAEVGIELLRMASIHTPNSLSTSMGLIAGVLIGQIAIKVGLFTDVIVLLAAISAIGSYITPSYELSLANKIVKLLLLVLIYFFYLPGLVLGLIFIFLYLSSLTSFSRPYLYPLIPFNFKKLIRQLLRFPYQNRRPNRKDK